MNETNNELKETLLDNVNDTLRTLYGIQKQYANVNVNLHDSELDTIKNNILNSFEDILLPTIKRYDKEAITQYKNYLEPARDKINKLHIENPRFRNNQILFTANTTTAKTIISARKEYYRAKFRGLNELLGTYCMYLEQKSG